MCADASQFAEEYESAILRLDSLTPHQDAKLGEVRGALFPKNNEVGARGCHLKAPAGAGKTFVALFLMLERLRGSSTTSSSGGAATKDARVLFVAANPSLTLFVARWLAERVEGDANRRDALACLHVMSADDAAPRSVAMSADARTVEVGKAVDVAAAAGGYELVVLDEAHHACRNPTLRNTVLCLVGDTAKNGTGGRLLLLSDVSQGARTAVEFPKGLAEVQLDEVRRFKLGSSLKLGSNRLTLKAPSFILAPSLRSFKLGSSLTPA